MGQGEAQNDKQNSENGLTSDLMTDGNKDTMAEQCCLYNSHVEFSETDNMMDEKLRYHDMKKEVLTHL
jgi:hypothetical protein